MMSDSYTQAAEKIIEEQENIIGPLALEQARKVKGLQLEGHSVKFTGNKSAALDSLVEQYQALFGRTSVEVCKEAARKYLSKLPPKEVPSLLR